MSTFGLEDSITQLFDAMKPTLPYKDKKKIRPCYSLEHFYWLILVSVYIIAVIHRYSVIVFFS